MVTVDARGYSCPTPLIMVQDAIKKGNPDRLEVLVDAPCAVENVTRYGSGAGYRVDVSDEGSEVRLTLSK